MASSPDSTPKDRSLRGGNIQVHIRRVPVHSLTNMRLLPILECGSGAQTVLIPCKDMTPEPNSTPKHSSSGEDFPSPYEETTGSFPNQCGNLSTLIDSI